MRLRDAWRFALGTWCLTALWSCAEGTLRREDDVGTRDNPFPSELTLTHGSFQADGYLPPSEHTLRPRQPSPELDAGPSDVDATADAAPNADAGN